MPIYAASFLAPDHQHGRLVSVARTAPKGLTVHGQHDFLVPPDDLQKEWEGWKRSHYLQLPTEAQIEEYKSRYWEHLKANWGKFLGYLDGYNVWDVETWLSWERPGEFSHRNLVLELVKKERPHLYGGADVPLEIAAPGLHYWFSEVISRRF